MPEQHKPATSVINAPQTQTPPRIEETPRHDEPPAPPTDASGDRAAPSPARTSSPILLGSRSSQTGNTGTVLSAAAPPADARSAAREKIYTGEPLSLNLKDADIKDVLRTFAQLTGLNIAIDPQRQRLGHRRLRRCAVGSGARGHPPPERLDVRARRQRHARRHGRAPGGGSGRRTAASAKQERLNVPLSTVGFKLSYARATDVAGAAARDGLAAGAHHRRPAHESAHHQRDPAVPADDAEPHRLGRRADAPGGHRGAHRGNDEALHAAVRLQLGLPRHARSVARHRHRSGLPEPRRLQSAVRSTSAAGNPVLSFSLRTSSARSRSTSRCCAAETEGYRQASSPRRA